MPRRPKPAAARTGGRRRRIRKLRFATLVLVLFALGLASFTFGLVTAVAKEIPTLDPARQAKLEMNGYILDRTGNRNLAVLRGSQNRVIVGSDAIAPVMKQAIVAVEDRRFFEHRGVDLRAIARAFWADVRNKRVVQGGSTITQQFVKNVYVKDRQTIGRKLKEAALSWQLEQRWSKERILTAYLNTIYFGNGAYGIEQASRVYFDHSAKRLTLPEAALLAGIPPDPGRYDPKANPASARRRRSLVLRVMHEQELITEQEYRAALRARLPRPQDIRLPGRLTEAAPYFVNYVTQQLVDRYGSSRAFGGGLRVRTSIDLELQELGRKAIAKWLTEEGGPQAALVAMEPKSGRVLAMIGGSNFRESQFNLAVQGERQAGSSFKPFVLAAALREGVSPSNTFVSREIELWADGEWWKVENYEGSYRGPIDLRTATIHSDNSVYAQLTRLVGPRSVIRTAHDLGIKSPLRAYYSLGLGAQGVNPLEMARAFSAFANGGFRINGRAFGDTPRAIVSVRDASGRMIDDNSIATRRVLTPNQAAIVNDFLQGVVRIGTGRAAALPDGRPVAGKTGTTENHGDAWFIGYTPHLVAAVWVGYPNQLRPMLTEFHGDAVAGGTYPALIWKSFMEKALPYLKAKPDGFAPPTYPSSVARYVTLRDGRLQADNGYCENVQQVLYLSDTPPQKTADCKPNEVEVPRVVGETVTQARERLAAVPLEPTVVYKPASPGQPIGVVVRQEPAEGKRLSAGQSVVLVLAKPTQGVVPKVVGLSVASAAEKLRSLKLEPKVSGEGDGRVVAQKPRPGFAAAPGMPITLVVKAG